MKIDRTLIYLSGENPKMEDHVREEADNFHSIGILLSYFTVRAGVKSESETGSFGRMKEIVRKNKLETKENKEK